MKSFIGIARAETRSDLQPEIREELLAEGRWFQLVDTRYAPLSRLTLHSHDFSNLSLLLRGSLTEESVGGTVTVGPGCVVFKPAGTMHANRIGAEGALLFAVRFDPSRFVAASMELSHAWRSNDPLTRSMLMLYALIHKVNDSTIAQWLADLGENRAMNVIRSTPPWLMSMQDELLRGLDSPSSIRSLAKQFDTHPVYLARTFRRHFGSSPTDYACRARIVQAAHELLSSDLPAAGIATRNGFSDHAHFCRQFRQRLGVTPGEFRRTAQFL